MTLLFAGRYMANVQGYVKDEIYTSSCGAANAFSLPSEAALIELHIIDAL